MVWWGSQPSWAGWEGALQSSWPCLAMGIHNRRTTVLTLIPNLCLSPGKRSCWGRREENKTHLQLCHRKGGGKVPQQWAWGTGSHACRTWGVLGWLEKMEKKNLNPYLLLFPAESVTVLRWCCAVVQNLQNPQKAGEEKKIINLG